jgi:hypothetical protein
MQVVSRRGFPNHVPQVPGCLAFEHTDLLRETDTINCEIVTAGEDHDDLEMSGVLEG